MNKEMEGSTNFKDKGKYSLPRYIKYLIVGGSSALIELLIFSFLRMLFIDLTISNIIAVVLATVFNFFVNRGWSFSTSSNLKRSFILYLTLFLLNLTFSTNAIRIMVRLGFVEIFAKITTMACITIWNYVLYRKVVFK
ncbi:GtrA-like protein [Desulfosporosinus acididurans]|uniref:GtrA-like protein n=1 Tax=Desulfosporosinus acididurans TaxID=476652 RepID=A0A0J1FUJ8_9FIRM|nr:GtrA-like protein [Desulfosporosinus acididurans]